jgi:hypothetical protein
MWKVHHAAVATRGQRHSTTHVTAARHQASKQRGTEVPTDGGYGAVSSCPQPARCAMKRP